MKSRGKRTKKKRLVQSLYEPSTQRNGRLMMLLEMIPAFQKEITAIRDQFRIPVEGYLPDFIQYELEENGYQKACSKADQDGDDMLKKLGLFSQPMLGFKDREPRPFEREIIRIGEKFRLPYNLYFGCFYGLVPYVLWNRIKVPHENWEIQNDPMYRDRALPIRWVDIRAYLPIDKREAKNAIAALNKTLRGGLPQALATEKRTRQGTEERLMRVAETIKQRERKAQGRRVYVEGSYLDRMSKTATPKKMREYERLHPRDIERYKRLTERDRTWRKNFDGLAKKLFGHGLFSNATTVRLVDAAKHTREKK